MAQHFSERKIRFVSGYWCRSPAATRNAIKIVMSFLQQVACEQCSKALCMPCS